MTEKPVFEPIVEYRPTRWQYAIAHIPKIFSLGIGLFISWDIFYQKCLLSTSCNTISLIFFGFVALICFEAFGFPIGKFLNIVVQSKKIMDGAKND